jgi:hypothetical protein
VHLHRALDAVLLDDVGELVLIKLAKTGDMAKSGADSRPL